MSTTTLSSVTGTEDLGTISDDSTDMMNSSVAQPPVFPTPGGGLDQGDIFFIVITIVVGIGMIGIGATVHYKVLLYYLKRPKAFLLGVVLQLTILPPLAWAMTRIFSMTFGESLGVFIQGCSPGGNTSNLVVYWMGGIVDLSVAMTVTTTLLSMGTIPLWLLIYEAGENRAEEFRVPYDRLAIALAVLLVPIFIGMVIRVKVAKHAKLISKIFIIIASIGIVILLIVRAAVSPIPWRVSWRQAVVAAIMPLVAFALGYLATLIPWLGLKSRSRKTVGVETALQNAQIASAIIELVAGRRILLFIEMVLFPLLYYIFQVGYSVLFIVLYNYAKRRGWVTENEELISVDLSEDKDNGMDLNAKEKEAQEKSRKNGETNPTFETVDNEVAAF